jgi:hypothetical protein
MQENNDERQENKQPHEMTSDELLDFVVHPKVAKKLRERVKDEPPDDCDSDTD